MPESARLLWDDLPPLTRDSSFWGMTATQFLGAFNDNLFKQLVLLLCVDLALQDRTQNYQGIATVIFSVPFILFSGFGGFLSDRIGKRRIVVLCKVAEIAVMLLGMLAFLMGSLPALMAVLFLMGTQSAFFGPAKYGILPEMIRPGELPRANGIILMTTFLAIIFGFATAGTLKELFSDNLWLASAACAVIAVVGTGTSLWVRRTPVAQPGLRFHVSTMAVNPDTRRLLRIDRPLLTVLLMSSLFWFIGGVVYPPAINDLGKLQLTLDDRQTGWLAACTGIGIAVGCILAGRLSHGRINPRLVRTGAWGMFACLMLLALPAGYMALDGVTERTGERETARQRDGATEGRRDGKRGAEFVEDVSPVVDRTVSPTLLGAWGAALALVAMGMFAGLFTVPLQVFLQARAPGPQKGRVIAAMNLFNWIGIALSGVFYHLVNLLLVRLDLPPNAMFAAAGLLLLPVALLFRPPETDLSSPSS